MTDADTVGWLFYAPRHIFRDVIPPDANHVSGLRARDQELFAKHGMFMRKPVPAEFIDEAMAGRDGYVLVDFRADKWIRHLAEHDGTPTKRAVVKAPRRQVKR